jgi:magnesium-transporting ATPase (P-type)
VREQTSEKDREGTKFKTMFSFTFFFIPIILFCFQIIFETVQVCNLNLYFPFLQIISLDAKEENSHNLKKNNWNRTETERKKK